MSYYGTPPTPIFINPPLPPQPIQTSNTTKTPSIFDSDFEHINEDSPVLSVQHIQAYGNLQTTYPHLNGHISITNETATTIKVTIQT